MENEKPKHGDAPMAPMKTLYVKPVTELKYVIDFNKVKTLEDVIILLQSFEITVTQKSRGFKSMSKYLKPLIQ